MDDLISRQAAIDALASAIWHYPNPRFLSDYDHARELAEDALKQLPSAEPDVPDINVGNMISRQKAIDALAEQMPKPYTPDGSHPADEGIFMAQEIYADCIETIEILPSAQPEIIFCKDCAYHRYDSKKIPYCLNIDYGYGWNDHDYCSMAKRRNSYDL